MFRTVRIAQNTVSVLERASNAKASSLSDHSKQGDLALKLPAGHFSMKEI
jgi:hypothetical protein